MSSDGVCPELMYCFNVMDKIPKDEAFNRQLKAEAISLLTFLLSTTPKYLVNREKNSVLINTTMSFSFYFEDGLGNVVDEYGNDPRDITDIEDPFKLEELSSYNTYVAVRAKLVDSEALQECQEEIPESVDKQLSGSNQNKNSLKGNRISNETKAHAVHLVDIHSRNSARAVALELKLEPRTVQGWYKTWKEDLVSLFKTIGLPRIIETEGELAEATKSLVSDFYYKYPTATIDQLMDQMTSSFKDSIISKRTLYSYMSDLWIFTVKKVQLDPVERNTPERIQTRKEWVEMVKELGVDYMSNCVFINESGLRKPMVPSKKRKLAGDRKQQTKGTVATHYANFIKDVRAGMDKFPEMKGHYLIMDNAPIHTGKIIGEMIEERGYKCIYLPPYSPELNLIEQFWSVVKSNVKREFVLKKDTIPQIIADASNQVA
ncbi:hypothetical protein INT47_009115 [Mucor saturninus]|uniref:Tc1-like transposase DDE domain-containing protein n=1 Tax=Mucor saturninus TaxID=64648 RepID=A0A8H7V7W7_9FUNG|nr:hypothetical protein INT47_009115 [Mucor saturninus]